MTLRRNHMSTFSKHRISIILSVLFLLSIVAIYHQAFVLGLNNENISRRLLIHALPVAISDLYHDGPNNYTAFWTLANWFRSDQPVSDLITGSI